MSATLISVLAWMLIRYKRSSENESEAKHKQPDVFMEGLAKSPARKTPAELFEIINSSLAGYDERDTVTLLQDGIQSFIRPGMGEEEVYHVRKNLLEICGSLVLLQSDRLYNGGKGNGPNTGTGIS